MSKPKVKSRRSTLFLQYSRVTFLITLITTLALCLVFFLFAINYWTSTNAAMLRSNVGTMVNKLSASGITEENEDRVKADIHLLSKASNSDIFITDADGKVIICDSGSEDKERKISDVTFGSVSNEGYYVQEAGQLIVGQKLILDEETTIYVFGTMAVSTVLKGYIGDMASMFLGAAIVSLVLALILVYVFSDSMTEPLREMSDITKQYAKGDFNQRIVLVGNNELTDLADSLNKMAESLAVLDRSRSAFVANVSHELKTPMTSIGGFIDGILDGTIPKSEEKKYLAIVSDEVKRLSSLVQTMLTLSKIEAGEEALNPAETDMKNLLFNVLLNFEKQINEAEIEISGFEFMGPIKAIADEKMLYQVLYNLFDNAVKFTNHGGTISVKLEESETRVTVSISNTGEGINKDELSFIFDRFYKVDKSRSEHVKGVGLGLNLAKNIVELHGGEISAKSVPGGLTTFSFWIPKK